MPNEPAGESTDRGVYVLTFLGGVMACFGFATLLNVHFLHPSDVDTALIRSTGGLLECLGLVRGMFAVEKKVATVWGTPRLLTWLWEEAERLFRQVKFKVYSWLRWTEDVSSSTTLHAESLSHAQFTDNVRISKRPSEDADDRAWIEYLDGEVKAVKDRIQTVRENHTDRMDRMEAQLDATRQRLRSSIENTEDRVERLVIGDFWWEFVSLFWFFLGVVATTWAPSLARWLLGG